MSLEFFARQSELVAAPDPVWERWTIDEIDEDVVRVLISVAFESDALRERSRTLVELGDAPQPVRGRLPAAVRDLAMDVEASPTAETWSEERAAFAARADLGGFLAGRVGKPGLPTTRPLREGDVFWIIAPRGVPGLNADARLATDHGWLRQYEVAEADVWDVTAAARQASKRQYHQVARAAEDDPESTQRLHGQLR